MKWTQEQAIELCRKIEVLAPKYGCHVALTGGTLYHFGERKDADILFYRIRQVDEIDVDGLMGALGTIGVIPGEDFGWCHKATYDRALRPHPVIITAAEDFRFDGKLHFVSVSKMDIRRLRAPR